MSDAPEPKPSTEIPGFAILGLFVTGVAALVRAFMGPALNYSGPLCLLVATLAFGYVLHVCFNRR